MSLLPNKSTREAFGYYINELAGKHKNIYALSADLKDSMRLVEFEKNYQDRFIECGVAEQNMMGIAAGIAMSGGVPFACSFAVFNPMRNYDQLRVSVCLSNLPVKVVGGHGGFSNFADGASHQAFEDIAITRVLPNMKVFVPLDGDQTQEILKASFLDKSPNYIRISSEEVPNISSKIGVFQIGKAQVYQEGKDLAVFSYGSAFFRSKEALSKLKISASLINVPSIKPLDRDLIIEIAKRLKKFVVVEDHQIIGGLYSAICEVLCSAGIKCKILPIGMEDRFGRSARNINHLYSFYGVDSDSLAQKIDAFLSSD